MAIRPDTGAPPIPPGLLSHALEVAGRLANDAVDVITATAHRDDRGEAVPSAHPFDWVTDTERTLERHTHRVLAAEFPAIPVTGEACDPDARATGAPYRWVVEPLEGTGNYVAGFPWYAYSLALRDDFGPVVGVIADPGRAQIYSAARGRGARANGTPTRVTGRSATGGLVCTELAADRVSAFARDAATSQVALRTLGSSALAITQVALGHAVAAALVGYREGEVAAAVCLAVEAGAEVVDRDGRPHPMPADGMIVAAPGALEQVLGWWRAGR